MKRRQFIQTGSLGLGGILAGCSGILKPEKQPNVLLITADDLGVEIGCYQDPYAQTPHLNQLAKEGVQFSRAFVTTASCSPSRSSIFTGLYPHQNNQIGLAHLGYHMHEGLPNLPALLKAAGYYTGVIGKIHVEPEKELPFDYDLGDDERDDMVFKYRDVAGSCNQVETFIQQAGDRPFFMMANYFDPHRRFVEQAKGIPKHPVTPDEVRPFPFLGPIDSPKIREEVAAYYTCIKRLDTGIGLLMEMLKKHGLDRNTLVIFLGDHGGPFTRAKATCYEAGVRVPFIVRWPGQVKQNKTRDEFISTVDILPTILDAAGIQVPDNLPGKSFLPIVQGKTIPWRKTLCTEYFTHIAWDYFPRRAIRDDRYKLILNLADCKNPIEGADGCAAYEEALKSQYDNTPVRRIYNTYDYPGRIELYDLQEDPYEFINLADREAYQEIQADLLAKLYAWRKETRDPLLDPDTLAALTAEHNQYKKKRIKAREGSEYVKKVWGNLIE